MCVGREGYWIQVNGIYTFPDKLDLVESCSEVEQRLLRQWKMQATDLFASPDELLEQAYQNQAAEIAYVDKEFAAAAKDGNYYD